MSPDVAGALIGGAIGLLLGIILQVIWLELRNRRAERFARIWDKAIQDELEAAHRGGAPPA